MKIPVRLRIICLFLFYSCTIMAQQDSSVNLGKKTVTLKEVVIRNGLNVGGFIERVKNDTTFYKAFRNLKVLGYTALNDIRMQDKTGAEIASLQSKTMQLVKNGCRTTKTLQENIRGDIYDDNRNWNYY